MKKTKKGILIFALILCAIFWLVVINKIFFPTYFLYPDNLIKNMNTNQIEWIFGEFDIETDYFAAYYIYTDMEKERHYYIMYLDCGEPFYVANDTKIVWNIFYDDFGKEPDYITLEDFIFIYYNQMIYQEYHMEIEGVCDYFGITEKEFFGIFEEKYGIDISGNH